jgi:predicted Zn-dependent peptidase
MKAVYKIITNELKKIRKNRISDHDLEMFKTQVKGALLLGADDIENRMTSIGVNEMVFEKYKPVESIIEEIDAVSVKSVHEFIQKLDPKQIAAVLFRRWSKRT